MDHHQVFIRLMKVLQYESTWLHSQSSPVFRMCVSLIRTWAKYMQKPHMHSVQFYQKVSQTEVNETDVWFPIEIPKAAKLLAGTCTCVYICL